ncbi:inositol monophosphatase family protein [Dactylosporangium sp. NPDC000555]|uniref:inositol monophosphatase family protein n=1 Tax=Dactylosporangium sp. NPDC000555 TaxID=3154260 RepID=UPI00331FC37F
MIHEFSQALQSTLLPEFTRYRDRLSTLRVSEKEDKTLLTEADLRIEALIIDAIRSFDPNPWIIAEESGNTDATRTEATGAANRAWIVDPIDGTAEFVRPDRREFCAVVCLIEGGEPTGAFVLAPELGYDRTALSIVTDATNRKITVNGKPASAAQAADGRRHASVTRSSGSQPRAYEAAMRAAGFTLKTSTTSQTIDMVRTAIDLSHVSDLRLPSFELFARKRQKLWDGAAGLCLGAAFGLTRVDLDGNPRTPFDADLLHAVEPTLDSTVMGPPEVVRWFLDIQ